MKTCKQCGKKVEFLYDGLCSLCSYYSTHPQGEPARRQSACYTTTGRYQAGEFAIIGVSVRDQQVLLTLEGSTWMRGDEEHDAGDYTSWYTPTDEEKQNPEYQRLAAQLTADLAAEEEATKRAQRNSEDPNIREYRAELDAQESTGSALIAPEPERREETVEPRIAEGRVARVEVRMTETQKDLFQEFCRLTGNHLSTFLVSAGLAAVRMEIMKSPQAYLKIYNDMIGKK